MYNGVIALILGEAWLFRSIGLAKYAPLVHIFFHLFVVLYEEPALESQFGESIGPTGVPFPAGASRLGRFKRALEAVQLGLQPTTRSGILSAPRLNRGR